ncbi:MAG: hypothetical protein JNK37_24470 [Verrucomicrobiales bacterium]|nr:hypothetical protein [Verrucomicrobiales bacterium]
MSAAGVHAPPADPMAGCTPLPDVIGPVFAKELRQGLRAHRFVLPFVAAQLFALMAIGSELAISSAFHDGSGPGSFGGLVVTVVVVAVGLVMPMTHIGALRPELGDGRNIELLLMSNLDRWQIVWGKWLVGFVLAMLMLVSLLPYLLARYFAGGVELMDYLLTLIGVVLGSGLLTGIAVGASGFGNLLGRFFLIGVGLFSAWGSVMAAGWRFFEKTASATGGAAFWPGLASVAVSALVAALYVVYGLQLGRARLRLFENPIDPPASGLIIALIIFTPIVTGIATAVTVGWGAWVAVAGLLGLALSIDRGPGRSGARAVYLQP